MKKYLFDTPLKHGTVVCRPNRFIMHVLINKEIIVCHCPSTGRIGNISLDGLPCLLSKSKSKTRKTSYTVEAISLDNGNSWVGINQTSINRYIEYFIKQRYFSKIIDYNDNLLREQKCGDSKLDFKVGDTYIEVKMPLIDLPCACNNISPPKRSFVFFERLVRHVNNLSENVKHGGKAIMLTCYMYDAPKFQIPPPSEYSEIITNSVNNSAKSGVKMWQANLSIDEYSVSPIRYFEITDVFLK